VFEAEESGIVASFVISALGGFSIGASLMRFPALRTNFFCITSFVLLLSNALGGLNSYVNISLFNIDWGFFIKTYNVQNINLINALSLVFAFSLILYLIAARQFKEDTSSNLTISDFLLRKRRFFLSVSILLVIAQVFLILTGKVTIQGQVRDEYSVGAVNPAIAVLSPFLPVVPLIAAFYLRQSQGLLLKTLLISILSIEFIWFFLWGRRSMLFMFCMAGIGYFFNRPIHLSFVLKRVIPLGLSFFLLSSIIDFYQRIRIVGGVDILQTLSIENIKAVYELSSSLESSDFARLNAINLAFRTSTTLFAIATADNLFMSGQMSHAYGRDFLGSLAKAAPSDFFVNKKDVLVQEGLYNALSNDKYSGGTDYGDTVVLASYIDFGILGVVFLYPLFILLIINFVKRASALNKYLSTFFLFSFTYTGLTLLEGTIVSLLVASRTFIVITILVYAIKLLIPEQQAPLVQKR